MTSSTTTSTTTRLSLDMSPAAMDELFAASPAGDIPVGRGAGTAVFFAGRRAAKPFAAMARVLLWKGKMFHPETHDLQNLLTPFARPAIRARVYTDASWYDGRPCVVLDYSTTSKAARLIRDEIRQVGPNEYLGMVFMRNRRLGVYFFLRFG